MSYGRLNSNSIAGMTANQIEGTVKYHANQTNHKIGNAKDQIVNTVNQTYSLLLGKLTDNARQTASVDTKVNSISATAEKDIAALQKQLRIIKQRLRKQGEAHQKEIAELKALHQEQTNQLLTAINSIKNTFAINNQIEATTALHTENAQLNTSGVKFFDSSSQQESPNKISNIGAIATIVEPKETNKTLQEKGVLSHSGFSMTKEDCEAELDNLAKEFRNLPF